jgi:hypothetical protein
MHQATTPQTPAPTAVLRRREMRVTDRDIAGLMLCGKCTAHRMTCSLSTWTCSRTGCGAEAAEGEHGQGDEGDGVAAAEGDAGQDADFGAGRFDEAVAEAVLDGRADGGQVGRGSAGRGW